MRRLSYAIRAVSIGVEVARPVIQIQSTTAPRNTRCITAKHTEW